ncbi:MAG: FtsX-like permease family protein [Thermoanaerobaculia bacterium]|nr:FtsX-like permease family protein [Thermoanaerobaculia bacterium]
MTAATLLRQMVRETRGARGRVTFFVLCLAVGVGAVVAVAGFSSSLRATLAREARQLLAADLRVRSLKPVPAAVDELLAEAAAAQGVRSARLTEMVTVSAAPQGTAGAGRSQLVELKAIDGEFPFYGRLELQPARPLSELLAGDGAVAAPELLVRLSLRLGDPIAIGGKLFTLRGTVLAEPDRLGNAFPLGPRLFLSGESLRSTGLVALGSRVTHRLLVKLPDEAAPAAVEAFAGRLRSALPDPAFYRIETSAEGQPELRRGVDRTERFLGLVALLSLVVGGVGVAQTVRAWLASRLDSIAVFKALGARPREILAIYLGQTVLLAALGSLVGVALGMALERLVPRLAGALLPVLPQIEFQPLAVLRGLGLGIGVALLFALPPLLAALAVPAARVLRREIEPLPPSRLALFVTTLALLAGLTAIAGLQARSLAWGAAFAGGLAATAAVLALGARGLIFGVHRLPRLRLPLPLRYGLAALGRPGAPTVASVVALGLGAMVVVGMRTVEHGLTSRLRGDLPTNAPTAFLIDIQPDQWAAVRAEIDRAGATGVDSVPVVMARLAELDGKPVAALAAAREQERTAAARDDDDSDEERGQRGRWALTREQRLTFLERLPADNTLTAGRLWEAPDVDEVSVEEEYARDLGLTVGSKIVFDVQGVPVALTVTSLRKVRWESFAINFFWVVEPGVLDRAPQMRIASVRLPAGGEQRLQDALAATFPNVTVFAIREVLEKVSVVLERIALGVRFLGGFTVLAGLAILAGAVAAGAAQRGREAALGKALGMTRLQVAALFATESAIVGLLAGAIGSIAGTILAAVVLEKGMEIPFQLELAPPLVAIVLAAIFAAAAGLAASARPLQQRPLEALRAS